MKRVSITLTLDCRDNLPDHVLEWMGANVAEHASHEFADDYDEHFVRPSYVGPPLEDHGTVDVIVARHVDV